MYEVRQQPTPSPCPMVSASIISDGQNTILKIVFLFLKYKIVFLFLFYNSFLKVSYFVFSKYFQKVF